MRAFLYRLLFFLLGFVIAVCLPVFLISTFDNNDKVHSKNNNIISMQTKSQFDSLDILFVGNSYCYSGVMPAIIDSLGLKSYNLGISTAGPAYYELVIDDYLRHITKSPKAIFLLVSPMTISSHSDNFLAYPIHRYLEGPIGNIAVAQRYNRNDILLQMMSRSFRKSLKNMLLSVLQDSVPARATEHRGFFASSEVVTQDVVAKTEYLYADLCRESFTKERWEAFLQIAHRYEAQGIDVVVFQLPTNKLRNYFSKQFLASYDSAISSLQANRNVLVIDEGPFATRDFRNIDHLNSSGAIKATRALMASPILRTYQSRPTQLSKEEEAE